MTTTITLRIECIDAHEAVTRVYGQLEHVLKAQPQHETVFAELTIDRPEPTMTMCGEAI